MSSAAHIDWDALEHAAEAARKNAYAPYSKFEVGAALLADDGRVFVGVNVENAAYPLCVCAERNAIAAAVVAGARRFVAIAIASRGPEPATPCGGCRQVLAEFAPSFEVSCVAPSGKRVHTSVAALLPGAFDASQL